MKDVFFRIRNRVAQLPQFPAGRRFSCPAACRDVRQGFKCVRDLRQAARPGPSNGRSLALRNGTVACRIKAWQVKEFVVDYGEAPDKC